MDDEEDDASTAHISRKEKWWQSLTRDDDTPSVSLSKETIQACLKPDADSPSSSEPIWSISPFTQEADDKLWVEAITNSFAPPPEDSLLAQTGDMGTFIKWFCKQRGITKLTQKDLEGPAYNIVKVFHLDVSHL